MNAVSVVVRSCNDMRWIDATMSRILSQSLAGLDMEIVNVDSGSTDGTYEYLQRVNPRGTYRRRAEDYVPGRVLNEAVNRCRGDIVVFNNSDCIPLNAEWLTALIRPLLGEPAAAATFGRQVARADAWPFIRREYERSFADTPPPPAWGHFFSLATSAARRQTLLRHPFDPSLQFSEDIEWSYRIVRQGGTLAYAPLARVEHSHNYTLHQTRRRFEGEGYAEGAIFQTRRRFVRHVLRAVCADWFRDSMYCLSRGRPAAVCHALAYRAVQKQAAYDGNRRYHAQRQTAQGVRE